MCYIEWICDPPPTLVGLTFDWLHLFCNHLLCGLGTLHNATVVKMIFMEHLLYTQPAKKTVRKEGRNEEMQRVSMQVKEML